MTNQEAREIAHRYVPCAGGIVHSCLCVRLTKELTDRAKEAEQRGREKGVREAATKLKEVAKAFLYQAKRRAIAFDVRSRHVVRAEQSEADAIIVSALLDTPPASEPAEGSYEDEQQIAKRIAEERQ